MSTLFKSNDGRISAVCDDQYSPRSQCWTRPQTRRSKIYMTIKTQEWSQG
jgi:hypothetical protein